MFKIILMINKDHWRSVGEFYCKDLSFPIYPFIDEVLKRFPSLQFRIEYKPNRKETP